MTELEIKGIARDPAGNILSYCGDQPYPWRVWVSDLVDDIEGGRYRYVVTGAHGERIVVVVAVEAQGKVVRTDPQAGDDLLSQLPRC